MRLVWRRLPPEGSDHELIWLVVSLAAAIGGGIWLSLGLPTLRCPFLAVTGYPCLTCGTTRCAIAFLHRNFFAAWLWNPLAFVAVTASCTDFLQAVGQPIANALLKQFVKIVFDGINRSVATKKREMELAELKFEIDPVGDRERIADFFGIRAERSGHLFHAMLMTKLLRDDAAWEVVDMPIGAAVHA